VDPNLSGIIVGGVFTLFGVGISSTLSRNHKITEFRQNWINSLREVFSETLYQADLYINVAYKVDEEAYFQEKNLIACIYKIKMYLNRREHINIALLEKLKSIPDKYKGIQKMNIVDKNDIDGIAMLMQDILKSEWDRVRDGENQYYINNIDKSV